MVVTTTVVTPEAQSEGVKLGRLNFDPTVRFDLLKVEGCQNVNGSVYIRKMQVSDFKQVRAILPKVSRCNDSAVFDDAALQQLIDLSTFFPFVIVMKETEDSPESLVGYAELHRLPHLGRGMDGRLEKVLILEQWRGKKIAQCVCAELIKVARDHLNCGRIDLTVEKPDAMTVYKKLGFAPVDTNVWRLYF